MNPASSIAADAQGLTNQQRGCLLLLLEHQWRYGYVPGQPGHAGRVCHMRGCNFARWIWPALRDLFQPNGDDFIQPQVAEARARRQATSAKMAASRRRYLAMKAQLEGDRDRHVPKEINGLVSDRPTVSTAAGVMPVEGDRDEYVASDINSLTTDRSVVVDFPAKAGRDRLFVSEINNLAGDRSVQSSTPYRDGHKASEINNLTVDRSDEARSASSAPNIARARARIEDNIYNISNNAEDLDCSSVVTAVQNKQKESILNNTTRARGKVVKRNKPAIDWQLPLLGLIGVVAHNPQLPASRSGAGRRRTPTAETKALYARVMTTMKPNLEVWRGDAMPLQRWLDEGIDEQTILAALDRQCPPHVFSLAYFDAVVREAHEMAEADRKAWAEKPWLAAWSVAFKAWEKSDPSSRPSMPPMPPAFEAEWRAQQAAASQAAVVRTAAG